MSDAEQKVEADAAGAEGGSDEPMLALVILRTYVQWASFIVCGCITLFMFWIHWGNAVDDYGVKWSTDDDVCTKIMEAADACPDAFDDVNIQWRSIFSLMPTVFVDMYTPLVFGGIEAIQHLSPQYFIPAISGSWIMRGIWFFVMSLFGQFGYAGNLGVYVGYFVDFGVCIPILILAFLDHEHDKRTGHSFTTAKVLPLLDEVLSFAGLNWLCPGLATTQRRQSVKMEVTEPTSGSV